MGNFHQAPAQQRVHARFHATDQRGKTPARSETVNIKIMPDPTHTARVNTHGRKRTSLAGTQPRKVGTIGGVTPPMMQSVG